MTTPSINLNLKDSITTKLLVTVFSIYFLVTLAVTLYHMSAEYHNARENILGDLGIFQKTFERGLAESLWNLDRDQLHSTAIGIIEVPIIIGVKILDIHGNEITTIGQFLNQQNEYQVKLPQKKEALPIESIPLSELLSHHFPLHTEDGEKVGEGTFYTSTGIVFQKVQNTIVMILVNAVVKTLSLWIIFLLVGRHLLSNPLALLTEAAAHLNSDNLEKVRVDIHVSGRNELKILEETFNLMIQKLQSAWKELEEFNLDLEKKVKQRTQELEQQNRKLEDLNSNKDQLLKRLSTLHDTHLQALQKELNLLRESVVIDSKEPIRQAIRETHQIEEILRPITSLYISEQAIRSKRVLLAETNRKQQFIAKMALGGTGVELEIVSDLETGRHMLDDQAYDILCVNEELIELSALAHERSPETRSVFMTSIPASEYLSTLFQYPFLSNIVSRNEEDRTFTLKNILTTVSKLVNTDLFGLEKYLSWGVEVHELPVIYSNKRHELVDQMQDYFNQLGLRTSMLGRIAMVAEELLMNAIYDAPTDTKGKPLYNHLPRTTVVELKPEEQGMIRYACDGLLATVSVSDPFGAFDRQTILEYLKSCYEGQAGSMQAAKGKGGAGRGIFHIMETSDLLVFNVKPKVKTEVIALFNIDPKKSKTDKTTSFHYFYG